MKLRPFVALNHFAVPLIMGLSNRRVASAEHAAQRVSAYPCLSNSCFETEPILYLNTDYDTHIDTGWSELKLFSNVDHLCFATSSPAVGAKCYQIGRDP